MQTPRLKGGTERSCNLIPPCGVIPTRCKEAQQQNRESEQESVVTWSQGHRGRSSTLPPSGGPKRPNEGERKARADRGNSMLHQQLTRAKSLGRHASQTRRVANAKLSAAPRQQWLILSSSGTCSHVVLNPYLSLHLLKTVSYLEGSCKWLDFHDICYS